VLKAKKESSEDYMEAILMLEMAMYGSVRSKDIANTLNVSRPSVCIALRKLRERGLVSVCDEGFIELTPSGRELAESVYDRHQILSKYLMSLGVDEHTAQEDACRIEHIISEKSIDRIRLYMGEKE